MRIKCTLAVLGALHFNDPFRKPCEAMPGNSAGKWNEENCQKPLSLRLRCQITVPYIGATSKIK